MLQALLPILVNKYSEILFRKKPLEGIEPTSLEYKTSIIAVIIQGHKMPKGVLAGQLGFEPRLAVLETDTLNRSTAPLDRQDSNLRPLASKASTLTRLGYYPRGWGIR